MCDKVKSDFKADIVNSVPAADCEKLKKEDTIKAEVGEATHCLVLCLLLVFSASFQLFVACCVCTEHILGGCKVTPLV